MLRLPDAKPIPDSLDDITRRPDDRINQHKATDDYEDAQVGLRCFQEEASTCSLTDQG
ncbi:hypothetical protein [Cedecea lapagei]|nr:hypothetical protein [Cedecea lapagei]